MEYMHNYIVVPLKIEVFIEVIYNLTFYILLNPMEY